MLDELDREFQKWLCPESRVITKSPIEGLPVS